MSAGRAVAARLVLAGFVALVVVGVSGIGALFAPTGGGIDEGPAHPEYEASGLAPDRLESSGQANPKGDVGVVLFDRSHGNRFNDEEVASLVRAINSAGGEVRYTGITTGFRGGLRQADVLVVIDPARQYGSAEVDAIEQFVEDGGRLVIVGEPNRKTVEASGLSASLVTRRSKVSTLASSFGISFGTQYLYDMEHNDGNFKNVVTSPPDRTEAAAVEGVEQVTMYTATSVSVNRGRVLLRTAGTAERGNEDPRRGFPVAALAADGSVMAVGDKTFLGEQYHAVADNDVFVQRVVEFMTAANHRPADAPSGTEEPETPTNASAEE